MQPDLRFSSVPNPKEFWANVRAISQQCGYTQRNTKQVKVHSIEQMVTGMRKAGLGTVHLERNRQPTDLANNLHQYFEYRADVLNNVVRRQLMDVQQARDLYQRLKDELCPRCHLPKNLQKDEKAGPAYLAGMVNMLMEANTEGLPCDYNPGKLTAITRNGAPLRTLARRLDGGFPSTVNPIGVWEVKEYYHTTTFGSRIADGVYETLLDGMELEELRDHEGIDVKHLLIVDAYRTWWECGRSYLCRLVDMLHMGYVDEIVVGREVVDRIPDVMREWVALYRARAA